MRYMFLIYSRETDMAGMTPADMEALKAAHWAVMDETRAKGIFYGAEPLHPTATATTVRVNGGKPLVTDGPFAETKDLIAGWMVIDVDSYERAVELAGELSAAPGARGEPIHEWLELRPFLAAPPNFTP